jgi:hypothetical protein
MTTNSTPLARLGALVFVDVAPDDFAGIVENARFADALTVISRDAECTRACRDADIDVVECDPTQTRESCLAGLRNVAAMECDWLVALESDDRLNLGLRDEIRASIDYLKDTPATGGMSVRVQRYVCGTYLKHGGWQTREVRVVRADRLALLGEDSAEAAPLTNHELTHPLAALGHRHIGDRLRWINRVTEIEQHHVDVVGGWALIVRPLWKFLRIYVGRRGYREHFTGLAAAALESLRCFLAHAKAWERQLEGKGPTSAR